MRETERPREALVLTPWVAFALCLLLTAAAARSVWSSERATERAEFHLAATTARDRIEQRMATYVALLRGVAGLVSRRSPVAPDEFHTYVARLRLDTFYPGTRGIGYTARFGSATAAEATQRAHDAGWSGITVWPATPRDEVHAIVLLEPSDERNRAALGYDMHTEETRRVAMDRARDEGTTRLSGRVTLVQEIERKKQPGFLLYTPVYDYAGVPPTIEARRAHLKGFAYAPLRAGDLFEGIVGQARPGVVFDVWDGSAPRDGRWLYTYGRSIEPHDEVSLERLNVAGRVWTVRFARRRAAPFVSMLAIDVAAFGFLLSLVVFAIARLRERSHRRELVAESDAKASAERLELSELFLGVVGHDLRNPLSAIALSASTIAREHPADTPTGRAARRIVNSSARMTRLIEQILDVTRVRLGGGIRIVRGPADVTAIVRDVCDELARKHPECVLDVDTSGDLRGEWDADRLAQVFSNLVANAIDHRNDAPVIVRAAVADPNEVVVTVHNAGRISASILPFIFEPFRSGPRETRRASGGLGLGLYIARIIVTSHAGTIEVSSDPTQGTTFTVRLPRGTTARTSSDRVASPRVSHEPSPA